ncbi:efflux RND transporter permease subunit [Aquisalibacillus elongatus]|uniref:HAE1 family hydrophobic/amphiphilic exporter-1 n=1 Tax=Aquisalibacillus elongatus TaxID=485577 RepID=A0A3N5C376_9BACI|nr:efflux RND transporter permease subunit [Aquisalibacillus elongatus]RPF53872.1 HAE1 family hydrophobic/amphiphilic exporter-1 [Aquisalibacillus elongatus]
MNWIKFLLNRKILVGLITVFIFMIGGYAVFKLDQELFPPIDMDGAYVYAITEDLPATEVERSVTTPIEQQLSGIDGIDNITSTSFHGMSEFQITIEEGMGEEVYSEVESIIYSAASQNNQIENIESGQYSTDQGYSFFMDLSGEDLETVTNFAKETFEPRIEKLPEVRDVAFEGGYDEELLIELDREAIADQNLSSEQVIAMIQQSTSNASLGELSKSEDTSTLRWETNIQSVEDLENISIPTATDFITLNDVANLAIVPSDAHSIAWKNGSQDFLLVQIGRNKDFTQIEMFDAVKKELEQMRTEGLFDEIELSHIVSQAEYVEDSLDGVTNNILIGGILALVVLLLFLRNIRATMIVGLSIPASLLLTFTMMWLLDYSFNILSLIGLGLGIGMMVDSSIVILESIYRKKEKGLNNLEAVINGTKEVATAVIASMLTTIVVFLPIGLVGGEVGQFMIILSLVVAATLISSVIVAFTLIPSLSEKFLKVSNQLKTHREGRILQNYGRLVNWVVKRKRHSVAVISLFVMLLAGSMFLVTKIPMTIMPDMYNRYNEMMVQPEQGVTPSEKDQIVAEINDRLMKVEDVEANYIIDNGSMMMLLINMTKGDEITRSQDEINEEISNSLRTIQDDFPVKNIQSMMSASGGSSPVQINIQGENFNELNTLAQSLSQEITTLDGIVGVTTTIDRTSTEDGIELHEEAISDAGLTETQIRQTIEEAFLEIPVGNIQIDGESLAIQTKYSDEINTQEDLLNVAIMTTQGEKPLSDFISLSSEEVPNEITHIDGERVVTINAEIEGTDLGTVNREIQQIIENFETPNGYSIELAGDLEQQQELLMEMLLVLGIAIFLVYLVMAVQFNHLIHPMIVMSVLPITVIGVILGLFLTQHELSALSAMGIIMLIGIVLNNAILFIDRTNQLRRNGLSTNEALIEAGKNRLRPIFMTSFTTAAGMLPLALATGSAGNYQAPMATVIISGLLFATMITLLLIPAVYRLFTSKKADLRMQGEFNNQSEHKHQTA